MKYAKRVAVSFLLLPLSMLALSAQAAVATLERLSGQPVIYEIGDAGARHVSLPKLGAQYTLPIEVETGAEDHATFRLPDGDISVAPHSIMRISAPEPKPGGLLQRVLQTTGSALFSVDRRSVEHFQVDTPFLATVVKGTMFTVVVHDQGATVSLHEGRLEVNNPDGNQGVELWPGDVAFAGPDGIVQKLQHTLARESIQPPSARSPDRQDEMGSAGPAVAGGDGWVGDVIPTDTTVDLEGPAVAGLPAGPGATGDITDGLSGSVAGDGDIGLGAGSVAGELGETGGDLAADVTGAAGALVGGLAEAGGDLVGGLTEAAGDAVGDLAGTAGDLLGGLTETTGDLAGTAGDLVGGLTETTGDLVGDVTGGAPADLSGDLGGAVGDLTGTTGDLVGGLADPGSELVDAVAGTPGDLSGDILGEVAEPPVDPVGDLADTVTDTTGDLAEDLAGDLAADLTADLAGDLTGDPTGVLAVDDLPGTEDPIGGAGTLVGGETISGLLSGGLGL